MLFLPYISPNSSYGSFCSLGTTSLANFSNGSSYPQSNCPTDTSTNGLIFRISMILAIASRRNLVEMNGKHNMYYIYYYLAILRLTKFISNYLAACLLWDVALNIGIFGTITTSSSDPTDISSLKMKVFFWLKLNVPFSFSTMFTFSQVSLEVTKIMLSIS